MASDPPSTPPGQLVAGHITALLIHGEPPSCPDNRLLGLADEHLGPWQHPPPSTGPGSGGVSSTWLAWSAVNDVVVIAQIQRVYATQRDLTGMQELGLAYSPVVSTTPIFTGSNSVTVVTLHSGQVGYHKPYVGLDEVVADMYGQDSPQQPVHEIAAWRIAKSLGPPWNDMVTPTVMREVDGDVGSLSLEMPGGVLPRPVYSGADPATAIDQDAWRAAGFYDALIGQQDRHGRNALYRADGGLSLIDHGFCFGASGDFRNRSAFQSIRTEQSDPQLTPTERAALHRLRADPTLAGTKDILQPHRAGALRHRIDMMIATDRVLPTDPSGSL